MALTTKSIGTIPVEEPEDSNYEVVTEADGKMALREKVKKAPVEEKKTNTKKKVGMFKK